MTNPQQPEREQRPRWELKHVNKAFGTAYIEVGPKLVGPVPLWFAREAVALEARLEEAERDRDYWKARHDSQVRVKRNGAVKMKMHYEELIEGMNRSNAAKLEETEKKAALRLEALRMIEAKCGYFTPDVPDTGPDYIDDGFSEEEAKLIRDSLLIPTQAQGEASE